MNRYRVIYTPQAQRNAKRIVGYIKNVLLSRQAADDFIRKLKEKEQIISENPHLYPFERFGKYTYRKASVKRYIIAFRIDEDTHTVHIIAIGHSLQKRGNITKPTK